VTGADEVGAAVDEGDDVDGEDEEEHPPSQHSDRVSAAMAAVRDSVHWSDRLRLIAQRYRPGSCRPPITAAQMAIAQPVTTDRAGGSVFVRRSAGSLLP